MPAVTTSDLSLLGAEQLPVFLAHSQRKVAAMKLLVEKMTHEMAVLKRLKFAASRKATRSNSGACSRKRSTPTSRRSKASSTRPKASRRQATTSSSPSATRCRRTCRVARSDTSPRARHAAAAAR